MALKNASLLSTATTGTVQSATSGSYMQAKGLKITKFWGKPEENYDSWYEYITAKMSLLGIEDEQLKTGFFLMYLDGDAMNIMSSQLQMRYPNEDWKKIDFARVSLAAEELLAGRSGRPVEMKAEAYNFRQGELSVLTYYHRKLSMMMRVTNGRMPPDEIEGAILGGTRADIYKKFHTIPSLAGGFLSTLREAEKQANAQRDMTELKLETRKNNLLFRGGRFQNWADNNGPPRTSNNTYGQQRQPYQPPREDNQSMTGTVANHQPPLLPFRTTWGRPDSVSGSYRGARGRPWNRPFSGRGHNSESGAPGSTGGNQRPNLWEGRGQTGSLMGSTHGANQHFDDGSSGFEADLSSTGIHPPRPRNNYGNNPN